MVTYGAQNRLVVVWHGEKPRQSPLPPHATDGFTKHRTFLSGFSFIVARLPETVEGTMKPCNSLDYSEESSQFAPKVQIVVPHRDFSRTSPICRHRENIWHIPRATTPPLAQTQTKSPRRPSTRAAPPLSIHRNISSVLSLTTSFTRTGLLANTAPRTFNHHDVEWHIISIPNRKSFSANQKVHIDTNKAHIDLASTSASSNHKHRPTSHP